MVLSMGRKAVPPGYDIPFFDEIKSLKIGECEGFIEEFNTTPFKYINERCKDRIQINEDLEGIFGVHYVEMEGFRPGIAEIGFEVVDRRTSDRYRIYIRIGRIGEGKDIVFVKRYWPSEEFEIVSNRSITVDREKKRRIYYFLEDYIVNKDEGSKYLLIREISDFLPLNVKKAIEKSLDNILRTSYRE